MKNWIELNAQRGIKKTRKGPGNERKTNTGYNMYAKKKKKNALYLRISMNAMP